MAGKKFNPEELVQNLIQRLTQKPDLADTLARLREERLKAPKPDLADTLARLREERLAPPKPDTSGYLTKANGEMDASMLKPEIDLTYIPSMDPTNPANKPDFDISGLLKPDTSGYVTKNNGEMDASMLKPEVTATTMAMEEDNSPTLVQTLIAQTEIVTAGIKPEPSGTSSRAIGEENVGVTIPEFVPYEPRMDPERWTNQRPMDVTSGSIKCDIDLCNQFVKALMPPNADITQQLANEQEQQAKVTSKIPKFEGLTT